MCGAIVLIGQSTNLSQNIDSFFQMTAMLQLTEDSGDARANGRFARCDAPRTWSAVAGKVDSQFFKGAKLAKRL